MFMSSLGVAKNPLSSSNNELFMWWLGPAASHSLGLPFTRGFQAQQGIFKIRVFQKELVFHDGEVYISGTTELSVEAPDLATLFFFPVWAHTCIAVAGIPAGMVMFSPSLEITSGFSVGPVAPTMDAPGGTDQGCVCSLCSSASWDKDSFPEASGTPGCAPSKGRALASSTCSFPLGRGGNAQTPASCAF